MILFFSMKNEDIKKGMRHSFHLVRTIFFNAFSVTCSNRNSKSRKD